MHKRNRADGYKQIRLGIKVSPWISLLVHLLCSCNHLRTLKSKSLAHLSLSYACPSKIGPWGACVCFCIDRCLRWVTLKDYICWCYSIFIERLSLLFWFALNFFYHLTVCVDRRRRLIEYELYWFNWTLFTFRGATAYKIWKEISNEITTKPKLI